MKDILIAQTAQKLFKTKESFCVFPNVNKIVQIIIDLREILFFEQFGDLQTSLDDFEQKLKKVSTDLVEQIRLALCTKAKYTDPNALAIEIVEHFISNLDTLKQTLNLDALAFFDKDPAANSLDEIVLTYPGFFAVFVYRIANFFALKEVPIVARAMSEYAHSVTGIDIHPKAEIGKRFFIDHGTGVVVGESAKIGDNVAIYQGVTLGAISTKDRQKLRGTRRHPTIQDNVTIYSNATILGGQTVVGRDCKIGCNVSIVKSIPNGTVVKGI